MAKDVNAPRGMRDFLPADKAKRERILGVIKDVYRAHGFQEIETPALENLDRLTSGQGGDNEKLAFRVMKRGAELDSALAGATNDAGADSAADNLADLGLRFDLTVPLTRFYATNRNELPAVFKAIQAAPVWRAERPQKGRYRQFVQCDIDIIGDGSALAEIELLTASLAALNALGLGDAVIRVNHRELLASLLDELGVAVADRGAAMIIIDKLDKIAADGVAAELRTAFGDAVADRAAVWLANIDASNVPQILQPLFAAVGSEQLRFDPTLVRGMGYYTGAIFEIEHAGSGSAIGGGGRYDGMVGRWLGTDVPAVGISIGFERIVDLVDVESKDSGRAVILVLESNEPGVVQNALAIQRDLIAQGAVARLEQAPKRLNLLLDSLAASGFTHFGRVTLDTVNAAAIELKSLVGPSN